MVRGDTGRGLRSRMSSPRKRPAEPERPEGAVGLLAKGHLKLASAERLGIATATLEGMSGTIFAKLGLEECPHVNRRVLAMLLFLDGSRE